MNRESLVCGFCHSSEESKNIGPLLKKDDVVAHENCLYYSSNLVNPDTPDGDDLLGFALDDVREEMRRGRRLKCHKCRKYGASVGCEKGICKRSYHFLCALEDDAEKVEDVNRGIFKIFCVKHKKTDKNERHSTAGSLTGTDDKNESEDSNGVVKRKRSGPSPRFDAKRSKSKHRYSRRIEDDEFSSTSDGGQNTFNFELGPLESDLEGSMDSEPNMTADLENQRHCEDESHPSTSGTQVPPQTGDGNGDDTDIDSASGSPSLLLPIRIERVESIKPEHSDATAGCGSPEPAGPAALFWRKCHEAGCVDHIFSSFISAMISISERILSQQASEEDFALSLKVLEASGMLPQIFQQKENEFEEKLLNLQKKSEALMKSRSAMRSASKMKCIS
ncbi:hypothetical protein MATL_G00153510 [Megalops atlanticus]|uniref:PHD-type domain-containing protein n=1 Tax=Megalops atlanticus TaxID=7932 RepID=A0A9D3PUT4_MEGAT|nr:hypothetical protein MATL_G00153510 [Megalops atlanticus]